MNIWDQRYGTDEYFYGTEPNDFLREQAAEIPAGGEVLCLAEGEGRNAVYLAGLGLRVTAVDGSPVGQSKMRRLAEAKGVQVTEVLSDLGQYSIAPNRWDAIVSIWCHVPAPLRARLHPEAALGLKSGGVLILEAYHPRQLEFRTGGPPTADLMMTLAAIQPELQGLNFAIAKETERIVQEGKGHHGPSAVVQVLARKLNQSR